jgi:hypothetical protein
MFQRQMKTIGPLPADGHGREVLARTAARSLAQAAVAHVLELAAVLP